MPVRLQWSAVPGSTDSKGREFPILGYWVSYQPGGNTNIGFGIRKYAPDESCRPTAYPFYKVCILIIGFSISVGATWRGVSAPLCTGRYIKLSDMFVYSRVDATASGYGAGKESAAASRD